MKNLDEDVPELEMTTDQDQKMSFRNSNNANAQKTDNSNLHSPIEADIANDLFSSNKISMKDIDNYLS